MMEEQESGAGWCFLLNRSFSSAKLRVKVDDGNGCIEVAIYLMPLNTCRWLTQKYHYM